MTVPQIGFVVARDQIDRPVPAQQQFGKAVQGRKRGFRQLGGVDNAVADTRAWVFHVKHRA